MAALIYSLGIALYRLIVQIAAISNPKARAFIKGRRNIWARLESQLGKNTNPLLWIHCSSVGEYEQGRPVMEAFKKEFTDYKILVTFYSPSGYEAIETDAIVDFKCYLPFDSKRNAARFVDKVKPDTAIFVKYEFWHYFLKELAQRNINTYSVSSIFRPTQLFFKPYGGFYRNMLNAFSYFFVQDHRSAELLNTLNLPHEVTGDTRLDRVLKIKDDKKTFPWIDSFSGRDDLMVIGSMRKEDLDLVIHFVQLHPELKFIIAPHEITESMIQPLEENLKSTIRYSKATDADTARRILIIDNIGMLSTLYRYAKFAYVGGGFSDGLHNILEPAVYEIPVFFGNKDYQRFKEATDLIEHEAAFPVGSVQELDSIFLMLQNSDDRQAEISKNIRDYISQNKGASKKIIARLKEKMK